MESHARVTSAETVLWQGMQEGRNVMRRMGALVVRSHCTCRLDGACMIEDPLRCALHASHWTCKAFCWLPVA